MAPPSAMYGNKMHQNMMGSSSSHMPPYSSQSSGHYPQSELFLMHLFYYLLIINKK